MGKKPISDQLLREILRLRSNGMRWVSEKWTSRNDLGDNYVLGGKCNEHLPLQGERIKEDPPSNGI